MATRAKKRKSRTSKVINPALASRLRNPKLFVLLILLIILGLTYYFKSIFVAAFVNGRPISRLSIIRDLEKQGGKQVLDSLVNKELILQEAKKQNITVTQEEIDSEVKKYEETFSKQGQNFDQLLTSQGLTRADVGDRIRVQKVIEKLLEKEIEVTDEEIKKYFDDNKASYTDKKFEDVKGQIRDQLKQTKLQEKFQPWLDNLKSQSKINYFKIY